MKITVQIKDRNQIKKIKCHKRNIFIGVDIRETRPVKEKQLIQKIISFRGHGNQIFNQRLKNYKEGMK